MVLSANIVAFCLTVLFVSKAPCVSMSRIATSSPVVGIQRMKGLLHIRIPFVSGLDPDFQENPVRDSSLSDIHSVFLSYTSYNMQSTFYKTKDRAVTLCYPLPPWKLRNV